MRLMCTQVVSKLCETMPRTLRALFGNFLITFLVIFLHSQALYLSLLKHVEKKPALKSFWPNYSINQINTINYSKPDTCTLSFQKCRIGTLKCNTLMASSLWYMVYFKSKVPCYPCSQAFLLSPFTTNPALKYFDPIYNDLF